MPHDLPPWPVVYQQTQRWLAAGCFETIVHDRRIVLRLAEGRRPHPRAAIFDSQTVPSVPESGMHAGYDGAKRERGSKVHVAVDTLGHLLALYATPADAQDRAQVAELARRVRAVTDEHVEVAFADQGYPGPQPAADAAAHGLRLEVVTLPEAKRGFVLLPRRWVVERTFAWKMRFRRLRVDYEATIPASTALIHVAMVHLTLRRLARLSRQDTVSERQTWPPTLAPPSCPHPCRRPGACCRRRRLVGFERAVHTGPAASLMSTIVLVHGAWLGGWCWRDLVPVLRAAGAEVYTPTLTGLGERAHLGTPQTGLETHIRDVANVLEYEDLREVVLVGHSYAGLVIAGAADRVPRRVAHLVYLAANLPRPGRSLFDSWSVAGRRAVEEEARAAGAGWRWPLPADLGATGADLGPEALAWLRSKAVGQPLRTFAEPLRLAHPALAVPRTYVRCTAEGTALPDEVTGAGWQVREVAAGHWPMFSAPRALGALLVAVARSGEQSR
jgi:transposase/pimeloyl-ACP methyl ester carboxylesterase